MTTPIRGGFTAKFYSDAPTLQDADGTRHWVTRGANFVVVATQAVAGAKLRRSAAAQGDEYGRRIGQHGIARTASHGQHLDATSFGMLLCNGGAYEHQLRCST